MRAAIVAMLWVCSTAHAAPRGTLERVDNGHATLTFVFQSDSRDGVEIQQDIALPVGMSATGLTVALGDAEPAKSLAIETDRARLRYDSIVAQIKDPALLAYEQGGLVLHVFPVRRGEPARVVIELTATGLVKANDLVCLDKHVGLIAAPGLVENKAAQYAMLVVHRPEIAPPVRELF